MQYGGIAVPDRHGQSPSIPRCFDLSNEVVLTRSAWWRAYLLTLSDIGWRSPPAASRAHNFIAIGISCNWQALRAAHNTVMTPASPMRCHGSPSTSASNCARVSLSAAAPQRRSAAAPFLGQTNLPALSRRAASHTPMPSCTAKRDQRKSGTCRVHVITLPANSGRWPPAACRHRTCSRPRRRQRSGGHNHANGGAERPRARARAAVRTTTTLGAVLHGPRSQAREHGGHARLP